jgi:hypothetical protein
MQILRMHQKMDMLLEEQMMTLFDIQGKQYKLLKEINNKVDKITN